MTKSLNINTADSNKISVGLDVNGKISQKTSESKLLKSEAALPLIDEILKKNKLTVQDVDSINVNLGPGSFTGIRVGLAIANTLGFLLEIPINGKKVGELAEPVYNK